MPSPWGWFLHFCSLGIRNTSSSSRSPSFSKRFRIDLRAWRHVHGRFSAALSVVPSTNDCNLAGRTFRSSSFFLLALFLLRPLPRWMPGTLRPTVRTHLAVVWASRTAQRTDRRSRSGVHPAHESPRTCLRGWFRTPALLSLGIVPTARSSTWFSSSAWSMRFPCLFTTRACLDGSSAEPGPHPAHHEFRFSRLGVLRPVLPSYLRVGLDGRRFVVTRGLPFPRLGRTHVFTRGTIEDSRER